jgi:hypothetical protein
MFVLLDALLALGGVSPIDRFVSVSLPKRLTILPYRHKMLWKVDTHPPDNEVNTSL